MEDNQHRLIKILHKRFLETYPETFIKSKTLDAEVYKNANGAMYSWYIVFINSFNEYRLEGEYKHTSEDIINNVNHQTKVDKFLNDLSEVDNWIEFLIRYMPSKY